MPFPASTAVSKRRSHFGFGSGRASLEPAPFLLLHKTLSSSMHFALAWSQPANQEQQGLGAWARTSSQIWGQPASQPDATVCQGLCFCVCVHAGAPTGTRRLLAASPLHHREGGCQELEGFAPAKGGCQEQLAAKSFAHGSDTQRALRLQKGLCGCQGVRGCQEVD